MPRALAPFALLAPLALAAPFALADAIDPTMPETVVVGPPRGAAPMARLDGARAGRSATALPDAPRTLWRKLTHAGLDLLPVAVDERGSITIAAANMPELVELGSDGEERWRARTGSGTPVTGPVLLGDGTRVVVNGAGEACGITPNGTPKFRTALGVQGRAARLPPLPLEDGGVAIATGSDVTLLDADGRVASRIAIGERLAGALVETPRGLVATTERGAVWLLRPPASARRLGTLGGTPGPGAALADPRTLLAVVDARRLVAFDLATGTEHGRFAAATPSIDGPPTLGASGSAWVVSFAGLLLGWDASGAELRRVPLDTQSALVVPDGGRITLDETLLESPPPIADRDGRLAFARPRGRIGVVSAEGTVSIVESPTCERPVALAPAGDRKMVVACRDGIVIMLGP